MLWQEVGDDVEELLMLRMYETLYLGYSGHGMISDWWYLELLVCYIDIEQ